MSAPESPRFSLAFDTILKVLRLGPAVEGTASLGYPASSVHWIGLIQLVCLSLYLVPRTRCSARSS